MAGVLERLIWHRDITPFMPHCDCEPDLCALELQTAKDILQEVFGASPADVDDMIRCRLEDRFELEAF